MSIFALKGKNIECLSLHYRSPKVQFTTMTTSSKISSGKQHINLASSVAMGFPSPASSPPSATLSPHNRHPLLPTSHQPPHPSRSRLFLASRQSSLLPFWSERNILSTMAIRHRYDASLVSWVWGGSLANQTRSGAASLVG